MTQETLPICLNDPDERGFFEEIQVGRFAKISFMKTLRVPDDGKSYPLPMGLGRFPIHRVADYAEKVPNSWLKEGGFFIPMYQGEAMYMNFDGVDWHPNIAKICVGRINAVTAEKYSNDLSSIKQDYVVIPDQRRLDGVATGKDKVRQFVAMPLGKGYTIEAQITDEEIYGGFQITVFDAKDDKFPDRDIESEVNLLGRRKDVFLYQEGEIMGIAPGGIIDLQIFQDPYGMHTWDSQKNATFTVHLVNSQIYKSITGFDPPQKPIGADTYQRLGYPWFHYYDETSPTVEPPSAFKRLISVAAIECKRFLHIEEQKIVIDEKLIKKIKTPTKEEAIKNHREKAINHFENKDWKVAKKEITFVIDFFTDVSEQDYLVRSLCNFELKNYKEADIDAQYALDINPYNMNIIKIRSECLLKLEDYDEMIEFAEEVIRSLAGKHNKYSGLKIKIPENDDRLLMLDYAKKIKSKGKIFSKISGGKTAKPLKSDSEISIKVVNKKLNHYNGVESIAIDKNKFCSWIGMGYSVIEISRLEKIKINSNKIEQNMNILLHSLSAKFSESPQISEIESAIRYLIKTFQDLHAKLDENNQEKLIQIAVEKSFNKYKYD